MEWLSTVFIVAFELFLSFSLMSNLMLLQPIIICKFFVAKFTFATSLVHIFYVIREDFWRIETHMEPSTFLERTVPFIASSISSEHFLNFTLNFVLRGKSSRWNRWFGHFKRINHSWWLIWKGLNYITRLRWLFLNRPKRSILLRSSFNLFQGCRALNFVCRIDLGLLVRNTKRW